MLDIGQGFTLTDVYIIDVIMISGIDCFVPGYQADLWYMRYRKHNVYLHMSLAHIQESIKL